MINSRKLGTGGLFVSEIGLGCMGMSAWYGEIDEVESTKTIHRAIEMGMNFLDTADMYGAGKNEELVGNAIRDRRDKVILATKFGNATTIDANGNPVRSINGRPEYVRQACEASLKRLGLDVIDLYYQHRVDRSTPIEETVGAMAELVTEGKVRYLGLSEASAETIRRANAVHPIAALQSEYSLWSRDIEAEILPTLRELGIGLVAYSPLGRGFLAGQFKANAQIPSDDFRSLLPRFQGESFDKNLSLLNNLEAIAREKNVTVPQLSLAWVLAKGEDIVPIPGTKRRKYLEENAGAADIVLSAEDITRIEAAVPAEAIQGTRYPAQMMGSLNG